VNKQHELTTFETTNGRYTYLPERDIIGAIKKADAATRRALKRGTPMTYGGHAPVPVFGSRWDSRQPTDNLLGRTIQWIERRLQAEDLVVVHLFRPRPGNRQCARFNHEISDRFRGEIIDQHLLIKWVDPEEWGL
jgi:hypothetical protein